MIANINAPLSEEEKYILGRKTERLNISVAMVLGKRIVAGGMKEDSLLPKEQELCELIGVSRTALREAVKTLIEKGIIRTKQKAGTLVNPRSQWNLFDSDVLTWVFEGDIPVSLLHDVIELRSSIEPMVVRLAAQRATSADIEEMELAYEQMISSETNVQHSEADVRFHMAILESSKNELMLQFKSVIKTILECSFKIQHSTELGFHASEEGLDLHRKILERIKAGDSEGGEILMRYIIIRAKEELDSNILKI
ncbi:FadR/GntR family transcriptional regulator [Vibrio cortegadensis]|uniref:FadR/GntR family transcriptional regulator n=1 Tax=Vibrio cortegadensis TaxID=1328770 RepID=UPI0021C4561C|nr:FadR/GntR family transcriptional regulator [Vibrio cortegadensis]MDN3697499.1 FadR/GntR family transcriptional regulator [Vibrio cortegadensis]